MSGNDEEDTVYDNRVSQTRYEAYQVSSLEHLLLSSRLPD